MTIDHNEIVSNADTEADSQIEIEVADGTTISGNVTSDNYPDNNGIENNESDITAYDGADTDCGTYEDHEYNLVKLLPPPDKLIYFGAFPDFGGPEDNVTEKRISDFETLAGKKIAWAYFSQNWFNGITYPEENIHRIINHGTIPFVRLMPRSDEEEYHGEKLFSMKNIVEGKFDKEITQWAKDARNDFKKTNVPLLVDFAVEMNGDWFSWSGYYNGKGTTDLYGDKDYPDGPELYRDAYRHIIDLFRKEHVTHITWFFHIDIYSNPDAWWNQPVYYYPGDDYIDWLGVSIYGPLTPEEDYWETFSSILYERYRSILEIAEDKPVALLEFGVTDNHPLGTKADWLEDAFDTILDNDIIAFKAISYWHETWEENDGVFATLRIDSSRDSLEKFKELVADERLVSQLNFSGNSLSKKEHKIKVPFKPCQESVTQTEGWQRD